MVQNLFNFMISIIQRLGEFGTWLTTDLPYINMSPLVVISIGGISTLLGIHLVKLFL